MAIHNVAAVGIRVRPDTSNTGDALHKAVRKLERDKESTIHLPVESGVETRTGKNFFGAQLEKDLEVIQGRLDRGAAPLKAQIVPDTSKLMEQLQTSVKRINKAIRTTGVKIAIPVRFDIDSIRRAVRDGIRYTQAETDRSDPVQIKVDLDVRHVKREWKRLKEELDGDDVELKVDIDYSIAARAKMAAVSRNRFVDIFVRINKASLATATSTLAALSGLNLFQTAGREFKEFITNIDTVALKLGKLGLIAGNVASAVLASSSALAGIASGLGSLGAFALATPALLASAAAGITAYVMAFKGFKDAVGGDVDALALLPKQAQEAAKSLQGTYTSIQVPVQKSFWAEMGDSVQQFVKNVLPEMREGMIKVGAQSGKTLREIVSSFTDLGGKGLFAGMFDNLAKGMENASFGIRPFMQSIINLGNIGSRYLPQLGTYFRDQMDTFSSWLREAERTGRVTQWIENAKEAAHDLGQILKDVKGTFSAIFDTMQAGGAGSLDTLAKTMDRIRDTVEGPVFQEAMATLFGGAHTGVNNARGGLKDVLGSLAKIAPTLAGIMATAGAVLGTALSGIADAITRPAFTSGLTNLFGGLETGIAGFVKYLPSIADTLGGLGTLVGKIFENVLPVVGEVFAGLDNILGDLLPSLEELVPVLSELVANGFTALADILPVLVVPLRLMIDFFNALPSGIEGTIAALLGLFLLLRRFSNTKALAAAGLTRGTPAGQAAVRANNPFSGLLGGLNGTPGKITAAFRDIGQSYRAGYARTARALSAVTTRTPLLTAGSKFTTGSVQGMSAFSNTALAPFKDMGGNTWRSITSDAFRGASQFQRAVTTNGLFGIKASSFDRAAQPISAGLKRITDSFPKEASRLSRGVSGFGSALSAGVGKLGSGLGSGFSAANKAVVSGFRSVGSTAASTGSSLGSALRAAGAKAGTGFGEALGKAMNTPTVKRIDWAPTLVQRSTERYATAMKDMIARNNALFPAMSLGNMFGTLFGSSLTNGVERIKSAFAGFAAFGTTVANGMRSGVSAAQTGVRNIASALGKIPAALGNSALATGFRNLTSGFANAGNTVRNNMIGLVGNIVTTWQGAALRLGPPITNALSGISNAVRRFAAPIASGLSGAMNAGMRAANSALRTGVSGLAMAGRGLWGALGGGWGIALALAFSVAMDAAANKRQLKAIDDAAKDTNKSIADAALASGTSIQKSAEAQKAAYESLRDLTQGAPGDGWLNDIGFGNKIGAGGIGTIEEELAKAGFDKSRIAKYMTGVADDGVGAFLTGLRDRYQAEAGSAIERFGLFDGDNAAQSAQEAVNKINGILDTARQSNAEYAAEMMTTAGRTDFLKKQVENIKEITGEGLTIMSAAAVTASAMVIQPSGTFDFAPDVENFKRYASAAALALGGDEETVANHQITLEREFGKVDDTLKRTGRSWKDMSNEDVQRALIEMDTQMGITKADIEKQFAGLGYDADKFGEIWKHRFGDVADVAGKKITIAGEAVALMGKGSDGIFEVASALSAVSGIDMSSITASIKNVGFDPTGIVTDLAATGAGYQQLVDAGEALGISQQELGNIIRDANVKIGQAAKEGVLDPRKIIAYSDALTKIKESAGDAAGQMTLLYEATDKLGNGNRTTAGFLSDYYEAVDAIKTSFDGFRGDDNTPPVDLNAVFGGNGLTGGLNLADKNARELNKQLETLATTALTRGKDAFDKTFSSTGSIPDAIEASRQALSGLPDALTPFSNVLGDGRMATLVDHFGLDVTSMLAQIVAASDSATGGLGLMLGVLASAPPDTKVNFGIQPVGVEQAIRDVGFEVEKTPAGELMIKLGTDQEANERKIAELQKFIADHGYSIPFSVDPVSIQNTVDSARSLLASSGDFLLYVNRMVDGGVVASTEEFLQGLQNGGWALWVADAHDNGFLQAMQQMAQGPGGAGFIAYISQALDTGFINDAQLQLFAKPYLANINAADINGMSEDAQRQLNEAIFIAAISGNASQIPGMIDAAIAGRTYTAPVSAMVGFLPTEIQNAINSQKYKAVVEATTNYSGTGTIFVNGKKVANADGNILNGMGQVQRFASGGIFRNRTENHIAQIARGSYPVRIWAEPETQGEAYIPFAISKRKDSTAILSKVAQEFGYEIVKSSRNGRSFANGSDGGLPPVQVGGGDTPHISVVNYFPQAEPTSRTVQRAGVLASQIGKVP